MKLQADRAGRRTTLLGDTEAGLFGVGRFLLKVCENALNDCRPLNAGDHFDKATATLTGFNIDVA